jgi:hypothetical protein
MNSSGAVMLGSQAPRFRTVPQGAVSSWGPEAIDLAATVGLTLDPGQGDILTDGMSLGSGGRWLAPTVVDNEPRQNGKGVILEARALAGVLLVKEPLIVWTAHEFKTANQGFLRMKEHVTNWDHVRKRVRAIRSSTHATEIEFFNPTRRIAFLARSGGSGRGFAGVAPLFLDEAFAVTPEQVAALQFATSAHPNPQVWWMSSAPLDDSDVFRDICVRGRRGSRGMVYYEWSASGSKPELERLVADNKALTDEDLETDRGRELREQLLAKVCEANRSFGRPGGVGVSETSIESELTTVGVEQWLRERLGVLSESAKAGRIDPDVWAELADPESRRAGDVALGVDIALERDWAAVSVYGRRADGLGHLQLVRYQAGVDWIVGALVELRDVLNPIAVGMARGTYASLKDQLKAAGFLRPEDRPIQAVRLEGQSTRPPQRGDLAVLTGIDMAAACGQLIDAVRQQSLRHVPAEQVTAAVKVAKTRVVGDSLAWARTDPGVDITGLVSMTEARWAFEARINEIDDYDPAGDLF